MPKHNLAFALDFPCFDQARPMLPSLVPSVGFAKIGLEMFTNDGPRAVHEAQQMGFDVFLDLKLHDIPATVERAVSNAARLGVRLLTVHAAGGPAMLERAVQAASQAPSLDIVAVTVLTSLDSRDLASMGIPSSTANHAQRLATLAWNAGVRHFVCSPHEAAHLRSALGPQATLITPGIRLEDSNTQDQKRVATPSDAIAQGANLLVIGRPIRDAADPAQAAKTIIEQIDHALSQRATT